MGNAGKLSNLDRSLETVDQQLLGNGLLVHLRVYGKYLGAFIFFIKLLRRAFALPVLLLMRWRIGSYAYGTPSCILSFIYLRYLYAVEVDPLEVSPDFCLFACNAIAGSIGSILDTLINPIVTYIKNLPSFFLSLSQLPHALNIFYQAGEQVFLYMLSYLVLILAVLNVILGFMSERTIRAEYRGQSWIYIALSRMKLKFISRPMVLLLIEPIILITIGLLIGFIQPRVSVVFILGGVSLFSCELQALRYKKKFENGKGTDVF